MQFFIVLVSVVALAAGIWLVSRRMQVTDFITRKDNRNAEPEEVEVESVAIPVDSSHQFATDGVSLGPVKAVNGFSEVEYDNEQYVEYDDEPEENFVAELVEEETVELEYEEFYDYELAEVELGEVTTVGEYAESEDDGEYLETTSEEADHIEEETIEVEVETEQPRRPVGFPEFDEYEPYFGEYANMHSGNGRAENGGNGLYAPTALKVPEYSIQNGNTDSDLTFADEPVQTELEIDYVFPDFRETSDREIDVVGWLPGDSAIVNRMEVLTIYRNLEFQMEQPHGLFGFDIDAGKWVNLLESNVISHCSDLIMTMQLCYKGKPVSERNWWKFTRMVEQIADALSRAHHFSMSTDEVINQARDLNDQTKDLDLQAVLILKSDHGNAFSNESIEYVVRKSNLQPRSGTSVYDRYDPRTSSTEPLFSLVPVNDSNFSLARELLDEIPDTSTLILFCNLACVDNPRNAFNSMFDFAQDLEDRLAVKLVDRDHNTLNASSLSSIYSKIDQFTEQLKKHDITPGGDVAMRLFQSSLMIRNWERSQGVVSLIAQR